MLDESKSTKTLDGHYQSAAIKWYSYQMLRQNLIEIIGNIAFMRGTRSRVIEYDRFKFLKQQTSLLLTPFFPSSHFSALSLTITISQRYPTTEDLMCLPGDLQ